MHKAQVRGVIDTTRFVAPGDAVQLFQTSIWTSLALIPIHAPTMRLSTAVPLALALSSSQAFELPFQVPFQVPFFTANSSKGSVNETTSTAHRVAIIGAGAGGSSAAFWLGLARLRHGLDVEVDVYDKQAYVGGRAYPPC